MDFETYALKKPMVGKVDGVYPKVFDEILETLGRPQSPRILDFGFGDGRFFGYFSERFPADGIFGTEVSQVRIERARALGWRNVFLFEGKLPFEDSSIDFVNMVEVIEHIGDWEIDGVLAEIRRVLRPGGILLVTTPNYPIKRVYDWMDAVLARKYSRFKDDPTHVCKYSVPRLKTRLAKHFTDLKCFPYKRGRFYDIVESDCLMHKPLIYARRGNH
jgi:SAM-dependent methyltransferase